MTMAPALIAVIFNALFGGGIETALTPVLSLLSVAGGLFGGWWAGRVNRPLIGGLTDGLRLVCPTFTFPTETLV